MKVFTAVFALLSLAAVPAFALEPVPGSITYGAGPSTPLFKAPVGSPVFHRMMIGGTHYNETYVVQPGGKLKLVQRTRAGNGDN